MWLDTLREQLDARDVLDLSTPGMLTPELLAQMLAQPFGRAPRWLDVSKNQLPPELGDVLARADKIHPELEGLDMSWNPVGRDGLLAVLAAPFVRLRALVAQNISLWRGHIDDIMAFNPWPETLAHLDLGNNRLTDSGVEALVRSSRIDQIKSLYLHENQCTDVSVAHLATSDFLGNLRALDLSTNQLTDEGVAALVGSPCLRDLTHLNLSHNGVRRGTIQALDEDGTSALEALGLTHTRCGVRAIEALASSPTFSNLRVLTLRDASLKDSAIKALSRSKTLTSLEHLDLSRNALTDASITHLEKAACASTLTHLDLNSNQVTLAGALSLLDQTRFPALRTLRLRGNALDATHLSLLHALPRVAQGALALRTE